MLSTNIWKLSFCDSVVSRVAREQSNGNIAVLFEALSKQMWIVARRVGFDYKPNLFSFEQALCIRCIQWKEKKNVNILWLASVAQAISQSTSQNFAVRIESNAKRFTFSVASSAWRWLACHCYERLRIIMRPPMKMISKRFGSMRN